jgi:hypothetical protein
MRRHIEALYTHDHARRLVRANDPTGAPAPRFYLGLTVEGPVWRTRADLTDDVARALEWAVHREDARANDLGVPIDASPFAEILERDSPVQRIWSGPAFAFPDAMPTAAGTVRVTEANIDRLRAHLAEWIPDLGVCDPMLMLLIEDQAVSICASVRKTPAATEAGVETAKPFRGQRYAAKVVAAWAGAVREIGLEPLYSTSWQNEASRAVARQLSLIQFGNDLHIT